MLKKAQVSLVNLGLKSYLPTWKIQQDLVNKVKNSSSEENFLVLVQHSPVYTTGLRNNGYDESESQRLQKLGTTKICHLKK